MYHMGWTVRIPQGEDREKLLSAILGDICDSLNLCASIGCACLTGQGDPSCHEATVGREYIHLHSDGPNWNVGVAVLDNSVRVSIYHSDPAIGGEVNELHRRLCSHGYPVFVSGGETAL